jgi:pimeloyl-ACP methyl ester carboxylesterase
MAVVQKATDAIIRPPRHKYRAQTHLGPKEFVIGDREILRRDFGLVNERGLWLACSYWTSRPANQSDVDTSMEYMSAESRLRSQSLGYMDLEAIDRQRKDASSSSNCADSKTVLEDACVLYLHSNSSSRCGALDCLQLAAFYGLGVLAFDFAGCGKSDGRYISLGHYEQLDVRLVVRYASETLGIRRIGVWGRSMGAATALLYTAALSGRAAGGADAERNAALVRSALAKDRKQNERWRLKTHKESLKKKSSGSLGGGGGGVAKRAAASQANNNNNSNNKKKKKKKRSSDSDDDDDDDDTDGDDDTDDDAGDGDGKPAVVNRIVVTPPAESRSAGDDLVPAPLDLGPSASASSSASSLSDLLSDDGGGEKSNGDNGSSDESPPPSALPDDADKAGGSESDSAPPPELPDDVDDGDTPTSLSSSTAAFIIAADLKSDSAMDEEEEKLRQQEEEEAELDMLLLAEPSESDVESDSKAGKGKNSDGKSGGDKSDEDEGDTDARKAKKRRGRGGRSPMTPKRSRRKKGGDKKSERKTMRRSRSRPKKKLSSSSKQSAAATADGTDNGAENGGGSMVRSPSSDALSRLKSAVEVQRERQGGDYSPSLHLIYACVMDDIELVRYLMREYDADPTWSCKSKHSLFGEGDCALDVARRFESLRSLNFMTATTGADKGDRRRSLSVSAKSQGSKSFASTFRSSRSSAKSSSELVTATATSALSSSPSSSSSSSPSAAAENNSGSIVSVARGARPLSLAFELAADDRLPRLDADGYWALSGSLSPACIVVDSPFSDLVSLSREFAKRIGGTGKARRGVVSRVATAGLKMVRSTISKKIGCDIQKVSPVQRIVNIDAAIPQLFIHGKQDDFVPPSHSKLLYEASPAESKQLLLVEGGHNSGRAADALNGISVLLFDHLLSERNKRARLLERAVPVAGRTRLTRAKKAYDCENFLVRRLACCEKDDVQHYLFPFVLSVHRSGRIFLLTPFFETVHVDIPFARLNRVWIDPNEDDVVILQVKDDARSEYFGANAHEHSAFVFWTHEANQVLAFVQHCSQAWQARVAWQQSQQSSSNILKN